MTDNQYSFEMDVIEADNTAPAAPETEINGISFPVSVISIHIDVKYAV